MTISRGRLGFGLGPQRLVWYHGRIGTSSWTCAGPARRSMYGARCFSSTLSMQIEMPRRGKRTRFDSSHSKFQSPIEVKMRTSRNLSSSGSAEASFGGREPLRPKQSLGQNFLKDASMAARIVETFVDSVDDICPDVGIVEVGAGTGALTRLLLERYPKMHAIEIDQRAVSYLQEVLPALDVRRDDVLDVDWSKLAGRYGGSVAVIGNLPYNIVSQIMFSLFEAPAPSVRMAIVMMQKEVAERITAQIRTKPYGILSVVGQLYAVPEILFGVPPSVFSPRPSVDSTIVRFKFCPHPALDVYNTTLTSGLRTIVRSAFQQRRKTMRNSLRVLCEELNVELPDKWSSKRAEELPPPEFIELTKFMYADALTCPVTTDRTLSRPGNVWRELGQSG